MCFENCGCDDAKGAAAAAAEKRLTRYRAPERGFYSQDCPIEIRIEGWCGCDEVPSSSDDFEGEHLVCSHAK